MVGSAIALEASGEPLGYDDGTSGERFLSGIFRHNGRPCVVTMGSFDGVHHGHQKLLRWAHREARARNLPLVALTFSPRPEAVLRPDVALPDICSIETRVARIRDAGADDVLVIPFSLAVAAVRAETFVELLVSDLLARCLCVGEDFRLGAGRSADVDSLRRLGLEVLTVPLLRGADLAKVSSTAIRRSLARGVSARYALDVAL